MIVGCEDGLLGCILGSGVSSGDSGEDSLGGASSSIPRHADCCNSAVAFQARTAAAVVLERMIRNAIGDAAALEEEDDAEVAAAAAAASAAAIAAAEKEEAGFFRAIRVHNAAVLCVGVMSCVVARHL